MASASFILLTDEIVHFPGVKSSYDQLEITSYQLFQNIA